MDEVVFTTEAQAAPADIVSCPLTPALRHTVAVWISHRLPGDARLAQLLFYVDRNMWTQTHTNLARFSPNKNSPAGFSAGLTLQKGRKSP